MHHRWTDEDRYQEQDPPEESNEEEEDTEVAQGSDTPQIVGRHLWGRMYQQKFRNHPIQDLDMSLQLDHLDQGSHRSLEEGDVIVHLARVLQNDGMALETVQTLLFPLPPHSLNPTKKPYLRHLLSLAETY